MKKVWTKKCESNRYTKFFRPLFRFALSLFKKLNKSQILPLDPFYLLSWQKSWNKIRIFYKALQQAPADEHILTILVSFYLVSVHEILVRDR